MYRNSFSRKMSRIAILATAFFVFWIYLGSIINFHQHHIFGRTLMPQGVLCKREDTAPVADELPAFVLHFTSGAVQAETKVPEPSVKRINAVAVAVDPLVSGSGIPDFHGLRAPPAA